MQIDGWWWVANWLIWSDPDGWESPVVTWSWSSGLRMKRSTTRTYCSSSINIDSLAASITSFSIWQENIHYSWLVFPCVHRKVSSQCLWHTITTWHLITFTRRVNTSMMMCSELEASYKPGPQMDLHLLVDQTETESAGLLAGSRLPWSVIYSCLFLDSKRVRNDIYHFCCSWHFVDRVGLTVHSSLKMLAVPWSVYKWVGRYNQPWRPACLCTLGVVIGIMQ